MKIKSKVSFFIFLLILCNCLVMAQEDITSKIALKDGVILTGTVGRYTNGILEFKTKYGILQIGQEDLLYILVSQYDQLDDSYHWPCIVMKNGDVITGMLESYTPETGVKIKAEWGELTVNKFEEISLIILGYVEMQSYKEEGTTDEYEWHGRLEGY
ncbi:MAG TPA: hypothetical protein PK404_05510 [Fervidobacterium sp.]|nr:hypothetical protein [Fervidobacterium sp.]HOM74683.1 hypothetical protein [Fervidobacterium sp.]HPP18215.1 hypothetical protein [Fervidobacterium sp.]